MAAQRKTSPFCGPCLIEAEYHGRGGLPAEAEARIQAMLDTTASFLVTGATASEAFARAVRMCGRHWRMAQTIARQRGAKTRGACLLDAGPGGVGRQRKAADGPGRSRAYFLAWCHSGPFCERGLRPSGGTVGPFHELQGSEGG